MTRKTVRTMLALVALLAAQAVPAQGQRIVKGLVVDAEGTPLPGVSVLVGGKTCRAEDTVDEPDWHAGRPHSWCDQLSAQR